MGIFNDIYTFFYDLLFAGQTATISTQMQEFACTILAVVGISAIFYIAFMPIKAIMSLVFRGL